MQHSFSSHLRHAYLEQMQANQADVLVIGGGITGAGIALDAQARGMKTVLIEMQDFAAGTSSRSTKLVHGGLRYLKQLELKLVAEVGRERAIVYENGPHVTKAEPMLLPLIKGGSLDKLSATVGLSIYDLLAGVKKREKRKMLNAAETLQKEPLLRRDVLQGGAYYYEYRTDDARLTLEILKEAVARGTIALNYLKAVDFIYHNNTIVGIQAEDQLTRQIHEIRARKVVNATGPWVDILDKKNDPSKGNKLHITKGVHIVLNHKKLPLQQSVYFDAPDKRMIFAIPREGTTYVGTTDTTYNGDLANPMMSAEDKNYLLSAIKYMFPAIKITAQDIESNWVGLRPLIRQPGKGPTDISRKDEIFHYPSGLITIAGGKLTGYRKMAKRVVDMLTKELGKYTNKKYPACTTDKIPVSGGKVGGSASFPAFIEKQTDAGKKMGLSAEEATKLAKQYGSNVEKIYKRVGELREDEFAYKLTPVLLAQLQYSIEEEMALTPSDFFIRRTGALYFNVHWVYKWQEQVTSYMAQYFQWSAATREKHWEELQRHLRAVNPGLLKKRQDTRLK